MKGFIKKIIVFLSLTLLIIVGIVIGSHYIVKSKSSFKIDKNITKLVIGHSHSSCSVNDSIIKNTINLSASGESYFYNYQKLKLVAEANPHINTLFVEFANNHVDSVMDDWTWGFQKMSFYLPFYSPFMANEDRNLLFKNNSTDAFASYSISTRKQLYRILGGDYNLIDELGSYTASKHSKIDELIAKNNFNPTISKNKVLSETNLSYLRKMVDYCKAHQIKLYLIRSPQHPLYADLSNESVYQNVLKTKFSDVELLDFDAMNFPNSHYLDLHHLNSKGADQFSLLFNNLLENNLLNSVNKQTLIDEKIKDFNN